MAFDPFQIQADLRYDLELKSGTVLTFLFLREYFASSWQRVRQHRAGRVRRREGRHHADDGGELHELPQVDQDAHQDGEDVQGGGGEERDPTEIAEALQHSRGKENS